MNGFGGGVEPKISEIAKRTTELLTQLGVQTPVIIEKTLADLGCASNAVLSVVNKEFFPMGAGLVKDEVTSQTTVRILVLEISQKLSAMRDHPAHNDV